MQEEGRVLHFLGRMVALVAAEGWTGSLHGIYGCWSKKQPGSEPRTHHCRHSSTAERTSHPSFSWQPSAMLDLSVSLCLLFCYSLLLLLLFQPMVNLHSTLFAFNLNFFRFSCMFLRVCSNKYPVQRVLQIKLLYYTSPEVEQLLHTSWLTWMWSKAVCKLWKGPSNMYY